MGWDGWWWTRARNEETCSGSALRAHNGEAAGHVTQFRLTVEAGHITGDLVIGAATDDLERGSGRDGGGEPRAGTRGEMRLVVVVVAVAAVVGGY